MLNKKFLKCVFAGTGIALSSCGADEVGFLSGPKTPTYQADALPYFVKEWSTGTARPQTATIETGFGLVSQTLELQQQPLTVETVQQVNRPIQTVSLNQGNDGDEITDSFAVAEAGLLDLLIVIDDSDSMAGYQQKLGTSLPNILAHIGNTNWRIAVATTSDSCLRQTESGVRILTKAMYDANPVASKQELIELISVAGVSPYERGILTGTDALKGVCGGEINSWLRPSANISMLIVTDEENCGSASNEGCAGAAYETASYFTNEFGTEPTVHGLLLLEDPVGTDANCENSGYYEDPPNPVNYIDLITQTGGLYDDICTSDYNTLLQQISQKVSDKVNVRFSLTYPPAGAIVVSIDGDPINDYVVDQDTLTINSAVDVSMETLIVTYRHTPVAKTTDYSTGVTADEATLSVWLNDRRVAASEYSYNAAAKQVEFNQLPPDRAAISLVFRENTALPVEFSYNQQSAADTMEVTVGGEKVAFTRNVAQRKVILSSPPKDSAVVKISYERPDDKTSAYPLLTAVEAVDLEEVTAYDTQTNAPLEVAVADGKVIITNLSDIWNGRQIKVDYNLAIATDRLDFSLPVSSEVDISSVKILADGDAAVCAADWRLDDKALSFSCSDEDFETIEVQFTEITERQNSFTLDFDYSGPVEWRVFINEEITDQYFRFDQTVVIPFELLGSDSTVRIEAEPIKSLEAAKASTSK